MAEDQDESQKTEDPTRKRLDDALERGQVINSRELVSFFMLVALTLLLGTLAPGLMRNTQALLSAFIERPDSFAADAGSLGILMIDMIKALAGIVIIPFMIFVVAIIFASLLRGQLVFSFEPIVPKLDKISPIKGLGRLFSMRSLVEFLKSIIKIVVIGVVAWFAVQPYLPKLAQLPGTSTAGMLIYLSSSTKRMLIGICIAMFFIALFDYLYQRHEYLKNLRMTKQEIRDEYKQQEGDPQVKQRLRQVRMERARRRMMAAVPTADVIVTNPTHYSVALKYDAETMQAPRVVAKGLDNIALKIREIAAERNIPLYENPPLAQALYATVDLDQEVPPEHYKAVAEVISFVYRMRGKLARG